MKAEVDTSKRCLILKQPFKKTIRMPWESITEVTLAPVLSLADEIGMIGLAGEHEFHLRETDEGYWELMKAFNIEPRLSVTWYADVKAGKTVTIYL